MADAGGLIDTIATIETPESMSIQLRVAGPVVRIMAFLVDVLYRGVALLILSLVLGYFDAAGMGVLLIGFFLIEWFYPVLFEMLRHGRTPGKSAFGLRVVHDDGAPISWGGSVLRNLLRAADAMPIFYGAGIVCMVLNDRFKRIGDLAAGTLVVYEGLATEAAEMPAVDPVSPPIALSLDEQRAIIGFAERHEDISAARSVELAEILTPLTDASGDEAAAAVYGFARGLVSYETAEP